MPFCMKFLSFQLSYTHGCPQGGDVHCCSHGRYDVLSCPRVATRSRSASAIVFLATFGLLAAWPAHAQDTCGGPHNKIRALDHLVINVTDMERAISFYKRLGFALNNEEGWRRGKGQVSIQIGQNQKINLHKEASLGPQLKPRTTGPGDEFRRALVPVAGGADFALVWDGTAEEARRFLQSRGVDAVTRPRKVTGAQGPATSVYFRDPDGNLWEFITYGR